MKVGDLVKYKNHNDPSKRGKPFIVLDFITKNKKWVQLTEHDSFCWVASAALEVISESR